jgi:hypothetical protein
MEGEAGRDLVDLSYSEFKTTTAGRNAGNAMEGKP